MEENIVNNENETVESSTEDSSQVRTPRGSDDREVTQHTESWENPSNLPTPNPQEGWVFRYIRTSLLGNVRRKTILNFIFILWITNPNGQIKEILRLVDNYCARCQKKKRKLEMPILEKWQKLNWNLWTMFILRTKTLEWLLNKFLKENHQQPLVKILRLGLIVLKF